MTPLPTPENPPSSTHPAAASEPAEAPDRVWYVSYGSNLTWPRLRCYLAGGRPPGARVTYAGARDPSPPTATRPAWLPGGIYFSGTSRVWGGGGVAFYDPALPGRAAARAYLITREQFADVVCQEMGRPAGTDLDLAPALAHGRHALGPGRYETLLHVGDVGGHPMLTFTAPFTSTDVAVAAPSAAYLATLGAGLVEAHGWTPRQAAAYLVGCPGDAGAWGSRQVEQLIVDHAR